MSYDANYYKHLEISIHNEMNNNHQNPDLKPYFGKGTNQLSLSSLKKYASQIKLLHQLYFNSIPITTNWRDYENIKNDLIVEKALEKNTFIEHKKELLKKLGKLPDDKQRMFYNSLFNYTGDLDYQKLMREYNQKHLKKVQEKYNNNDIVFTKSTKEEENMITEEERDILLKKLRNESIKAYKRIISSNEITNEDFHTIQDYIFIIFVSGKYFPIRRALDMVSFKVDNIDTSKDNYYDSTPNSESLVWNQYKTSKHHGTQRIPFKKYKYNKNEKVMGFYTDEGAKLVNKELERFIELIEIYNNSDYLFQDRNGKQMNGTNIVHRLNKIFGGRKVSINMLRKSDYSMRGGAIIDSKMNHDNEMHKLNWIMKQGGSSISNVSNYIRG
jgi:hypothetical protein